MMTKKALRKFFLKEYDLVTNNPFYLQKSIQNMLEFLHLKTIAKKSKGYIVDNIKKSSIKRIFQSHPCLDTLINRQTAQFRYAQEDYIINNHHDAKILLNDTPYFCDLNTHLTLPSLLDIRCLYLTLALKNTTNNSNLIAVINRLDRDAKNQLFKCSGVSYKHSKFLFDNKVVSGKKARNAIVNVSGMIIGSWQKQQDEKKLLL